MSLFKRLHFFKGLFTTADDWKTEQRYHIEKRKLHNRCLHTAGVVAAEGDRLRVTASDQGKLIVQPGCAIDGSGHELYLAQPRELSVHPESNSPENEMEIFVFISFGEERADLRENQLNPEFTDEAFVLETPTVGWSKEAPDNKEKIELARVRWKTGQKITPEHINFSHVRYAGAARPVAPVKSDYIVLNPSPPDAGMTFELGDARVIIQSFKDLSLASGLLYNANVYPVEIMGTAPEDPHLIWRIESSMNKEGEVAYYLLMKNVGTVPVKARFEVYRLNR
jgi:hypothetical protein